MSEKIIFEDYIKQLQKDSFKIYSLMESERTRGKKVKRKPRDPEETFVLFLLDYKRWQRALETGAISEIAPRRYRLDWMKNF
ncbi:hypothetical protein [Thermosediminibacter litoriperuensis]|uniref:Uncharacterized protein n=1 Tax=Thermosediminibacter litoriperuensis TaxID=291989 RepID=A0A5S5AMV1_9FIRM|nr:hypothetical protein [Thermosediminibacter litoriperuensis]TYP52512.1 hypothetical protein LZ11_01679 [Thermosediminibacter litoriperuensis]